MLSRQNFVNFVILTYLVLLVFFFAFKEREVKNNACIYGKTCIRFCCEKVELCNVDIIRTHFNASEIPKVEGIKDDEYQDFMILFGEPRCTTLVPFEEDREWQFTYYGRIIEKDNSTGKSFYYGFDDFCFEGKNDTDTDYIEWDVKYCKDHHEIRTVFHNYLMVIALLFTAVTMGVYVLSKSLNTLPGRCEFMLLLGIFIFQVTYPYLHNDARFLMEVVMALLFAALMMMFLWTFVLIFDIWSTFRNQQIVLEVSKKFRIYCLCVFGTILLLIVIIAMAELGIESFHAVLMTLDVLLTFSFFGLITADVVLLLWTACVVFKISKASRSSDHAWFEAEKERYWKYLGLFGVMAFTWGFEMYSLRLKYSYKSKIVIDFVKLFSAIVIFVIFAQKKLATLIKRYETLNNSV